MDLGLLNRESKYAWRIEPTGMMRVPGILFASRELLTDMDHKVYEQVVNVASLPGIVKASFAMPDAHWGYGFPIGGVAAFDPDQGGVVSAGGVGFDISCGVRTLTTNLDSQQVLPVQKELADQLFRDIPAGVGSTGQLHLNKKKMDAMLEGGARWAVEEGYGDRNDLPFIEEEGRIRGARPEVISEQSRKRQEDEMGTLGSGNHYLEVQRVTEIFAGEIAAGYGLRLDGVVVSIHCGSRGLGHQVNTEFMKSMVTSAGKYGIHLPDRELAAAPIRSPLGEAYLGGMRAAINCALANREILTHLAREAFARILPDARLRLLYDVSHNTCKEEEHDVDGAPRRLFVHRKGATRAWGPGHPGIPEPYRPFGQPVLIGGTMGTASYVLAGTKRSMDLAFGSAVHGAGRAMSRNAALKKWQGRELVRDLAGAGIMIRTPSYRGVAEEAPGAYKDVSAVVEAAEGAGLAKRVARLEPVVCVKG